VDSCPFPKSQLHESGAPVDRSVNSTRNGLQPDVLLAEKFATGSCALAGIPAAQKDAAISNFEKTFPGLGIQAVFKGPGKGRI